MPLAPYIAWTLAQEARALLARLGRVKPFALAEPMLPAAAIMPNAQAAIERYLTTGRRELHGRVLGFLAWLESPQGRAADPDEAQQRFAILRLRFNTVLTHFDVFDDVLTQRSENETGVWLAGLDVVSADALTLKGGYYEAPPVICYLDRGVGAAIRRARTRLPGGGDNPCAVVRVPRERMVGSGIASSLIHEVGHQASVLLGLIESLRPALRGMQRNLGTARIAWEFLERWLSEILADFFSVARVGIASTMGLMGVVSLPRAFVFRISLDDPHPFPWIRVKISAAIGKALFPHSQWDRLGRLWEAFYPLEGLAAQRRQFIAILERTIPGFVALLVNHRPRSLRGRTLAEVLETGERQPARLSALFRMWRSTPWKMYRARPSLVFAVIGQARADGTLSPEQESTILAKLLTHWALRSSLDSSVRCAVAPPVRPRRAIAV
jgi:hypothetical protein